MLDNDLIRFALQSAQKNNLLPKIGYDEAVVRRTSDFVKFLEEIFHEKQIREIKSNQEQLEVKKAEDIRGMLIASTSMSNRLKNVLRVGGISTVGQLIDCTIQKLQTFTGMGEKCFSEIEDYLINSGLTDAECLRKVG